jgi:hypothetical protein
VLDVNCFLPLVVHVEKTNRALETFNAGPDMHEARLSWHPSFGDLAIAGAWLL